MPQKKPSLIRYTLATLGKELEAWKGLLRTEGKWMLMLIFGLIISITYTRPLPPGEVYLAAGETGSVFEKLGQKFVPYFAEQGIKLHLVNTTGSAASLAELADKDDRVNAALMAGGIVSKGRFPHLQSLGSIEYVPLWLFYRGPEFSGKGLFAHFAGQRVSVGIEGSAERVVLRKLLEVSGQAIDKSEDYLGIPSHEAAEQLIAGEIDALCLMDGIDSPNVQKLLAREDIHVANFAYAPAYVKKLPFLNTVVIPMGALDIAGDKPERDIQMLASTVTLLVESDMHPAIQQLFLLAGDKIGNEIDQLFADPEFFPAYVDHAVTLSPVAKRFYENGPPSFRDSLPLWLVNYVDRIWLLLLGAFAVIFPLTKMFPGYRRMRATILTNHAYEELNRIEHRLPSVETLGDLQQIIDELNALEADSYEDWMSSIEMKTLFLLKEGIGRTRTRAVARKADLANSTR